MSDKVQVNELRAGDYPAVCDRCGLRYWASTMKFDAYGLWVDDDCYDPKHDGDRSITVKEDRTVPVARPRVINNNTAAHTIPDPVTTDDGLWYVVTGA